MNKPLRAPICKPHGVAYCGCLSFTGAAKPFVYDQIIDASSYAGVPRKASFAPFPVRAGKTKMQYAAEVQNFVQHGDPNEQAAFIESVVQPKRKPAAMDAIAPGLTQSEMLQLVIDLTPRPAKPAQRRAAVGRDSSSNDSTADLNALYAKLHRTNKR
jgi:hypothetical protein